MITGCPGTSRAKGIAMFVIDKVQYTLGWNSQSYRLFWIILEPTNFIEGVRWEMIYDSVLALWRWLFISNYR